MNKRVALFQKDNVTGSIGLIETDEYALASNWNSKTKQFSRVVTERHSEKNVPFDTQIDDTIGNGWKLLYDGVSRDTNYNLN